MKGNDKRKRMIKKLKERKRKEENDNIFNSLLQISKVKKKD